MSHQCPACQRSFEEAGFCPFDGTKLVPSGKATVLSAFVEAQSNADAATLEPKPDTMDDPTRKVRAISASDSADKALDSYKDLQGHYDQLVGSTLDGRYFVQGKIGEGGMGVVFSAKHAVIERPLAI